MMGESLADDSDDELLVIRWIGKDCTLAIPIKIVTAIKYFKLDIDILFDLLIMLLASRYSYNELSCVLLLQK